MGKKPRSIRLSEETVKLLKELKEEIERMGYKVTYDELIKKGLRLLRERLRYTLPI